MATDRILSHLLRQDFLASIPHSNFTYELPTFPTFSTALQTDILVAWTSQEVQVNLGLAMTMVKLDGSASGSSGGSTKFFYPLHRDLKYFWVCFILSARAQHLCLKELRLCCIWKVLGKEEMYWCLSLNLTAS